MKKTYKNRRNRTRTKITSKNRFWWIYGAVCAVTVTALTVFLFVFYDIIYTYEHSQPQTVANEYAETITLETVSTLADKAVAKLGLVYEKPETYTDVFKKAFDKDSLVCRKDPASSTADTNVYVVECGEAEIMRLTLTQGEGGSYGMTSWKVTAVEVPIDGIISGGKDYTVHVPHGSKFTVNGFTPVPSETNVTSPLSSKLEESELPNCDVYHLGTLYSTPEFSCDYDGGKYSILHRKDGVHFFDSELAPKNFSVMAPAEAEVYVNGILLDNEYVTEKAVNCYSPIEKVTAETPKFTSYSTGELFSSPVVTAKLGDTELTGEIKNDTCTFKYPSDMMYTLTVTVPTGADVTVGGVKLDDVYSPETVKAFGELTTVAEESPVMDKYVINSLFTSEFNVKVTLNGEELNITNESIGNEVKFSADESTMVSPEIADFAMNFTKTYFHYTSSGYRNVNENLNATLAYIESGSAFYKKVKDSKIGYEFVTPVSSETYRTLEVSQVYELGDGTYVVRVKFDVEQTFVYVKRNYSGELTIHITGGEHKVRDMVIDSKTSEE